MKMNVNSVIGLLCSVVVSANAGAACPSDSSDTKITDLTALLSGNTVCVGTPGNWEAQEYHESGGTLVDYKHGTQVPKNGQTGIGAWNDWTDQVGTWSLAGEVVKYVYNGGLEYSYSVYRKSTGEIYFCNSTTTVKVDSIKNGGPISCD